MMKQYPGLGASLLQVQGGSHPGTDLLLERERQVAQERDKALRWALSMSNETGASPVRREL